MMSLGEKIRQLRQTKGFSQEELAAHLNVSRQAVSKWEKSLSYPDTENLLALASLFKVSADELAGIRRQEAAQQELKTEQESEMQPETVPGKKRCPWWLAAIGAVLLAILLLHLLQLVGGTGGGELPVQGSKTPVQSTPEQSDLPPATGPDSVESEPPAQSTEQPATPSGGSEGPAQNDPPQPDESSGTATPPPESTGDEISEFALLWEMENGWEHLSAGTQERLFPFGTSLAPTEMEKVLDTDFAGMSLHIVTCGALSLEYRHIRDEGISEMEVVDSVRTITPGYETPRGIGVGSDEAEVLRQYGDTLIYELKDSGSDVLCRHDYKYIYAPKDAFGTAVIFYISGGHVAGLEVRAGDDMGNDAWYLDHVYRFPVKNGKPDFGHRQEPEREEIDETRAVYIALHALRDNANLSAEEEYRCRKTIFNNLQYLDWQTYGRLGEAGQDDLTRQELLSWLVRRETMSADEITGLLAGACRSNLDGWVAESYGNALGRACAAYPVEYIKAMASEKFSDAERETVLVMTAHDCAGQEQLREKILPALEGDPLRYTDAERVWAEELARRLREAGS